VSALEDGTVRKILQTVVILITALISALPVYVTATALVKFPQPQWIEGIIDKFLSAKLLTKADIATLIMGGAPVVVRSVCYRRGAAAGKLNRVGVAVCIMSFFGGVLAIVAGQYLKNALSQPQAAFPDTLGNFIVYQNIAQLNDIALSIYVFYLATFLGLSNKS
jgi:hypothetical protein